MGTPYEITVGGRTLYSGYEGHPSSVLPWIKEEFEGIKTDKDLKVKILDLTDEDSGMSLVGPWGSNAHYSYEYDNDEKTVKVENTFSHPFKTLFEGSLEDAIAWSEGDWEDADEIEAA